MFEGKVVIVTGGTRGIGYATVKKFALAKAQVILFGSRKESVDKATTELKKENIDVEGYYPSLSDIKEIDKVIAKIITKHGHIDILINNAGISAHKKIEETTALEFASIMELNVNGMFNVIKAVVPYMKEAKSGVILNTSSMVSLYGQPSGVGYPASKYAVNGLTKSLARELGSYNIRVNAVAPGVINTDMVKNLPSTLIEPLLKTIPLGRIGEAEDIANAFIFLASDYASYITGAILSVDGAALN